MRWSETISICCAALAFIFGPGCDEESGGCPESGTYIISAKPVGEANISCIGEEVFTRYRVSFDKEAERWTETHRNGVGTIESVLDESGCVATPTVEFAWEDAAGKLQVTLYYEAIMEKGGLGGVVEVTARCQEGETCSLSEPCSFYANIDTLKEHCLVALNDADLASLGLRCDGPDRDNCENGRLICEGDGVLVCGEETVDACAGIECGDDGCGGDCGSCPAPYSCVAGFCGGCGDGQCGAGEDVCSCPADCAGGCAGCCLDDTCKPGTDDRSCGKDGVVCSDCTVSDQICDNSQQCVAPVVWTDLDSGLTWQISPSIVNQNGLPWSEAVEYCEDLSLDGDGWRIPTIGELRTLIRGCPATEDGGSCNIEEDDCLATSCGLGSCNGCSSNDGPADGCYWPDDMQGTCGNYWSSSTVEDLFGRAWIVDFDRGKLDAGYTTEDDDLIDGEQVRCVR